VATGKIRVGDIAKARPNIANRAALDANAAHQESVITSNPENATAIATT
jgi:hypothetical protein